MSFYKCIFIYRGEKLWKRKTFIIFFLLMINGEKINRSELIRKTMKTSRTIRRDMDAINRFY